MKTSGLELRGNSKVKDVADTKLQKLGRKFKTIISKHPAYLFIKVEATSFGKLPGNMQWNQALCGIEDREEEKLISHEKNQN